MVTEYKQFKFRRGTAVEWQANPVLAEGEPGIDLTARRMKVGDGVSVWSALPWSSMAASEVARLEAAASALEGATAPTDAAMTTIQANPNSAFAQARKATIAAVGADSFQPKVGTKSGRFAVSGGPNSANASVGNIIYRVPVVLPVTTKRWRMHWRNYNLTGSTAYGVAATITGIYIGDEAQDADGLGTRQFTAAPALCAPSASTPADGSEYVTPWVTDAAKQFAAFSPRLLSMGLIGGSGYNWARAQVVVSYRAGNAATEVGNQTITIAGTTPMYGDWWIEYEYDTGEPVGLHVGDSLTDGQANAMGQIGNHVNAYAVRQGIAAAALAVSGIQLQTLAGWPATHYFWTKYGLGTSWTPEYAVVWVGTNDIQADRTFAQIKADFLTVVARLRSFGVKRIYSATAAPRGLTAARETIRGQFNTWLRSRPANILGVFDYARAVENPAATDVLLTENDAGDGTHFTVLGQARISAAIPGKLGG